MTTSPCVRRGRFIAPRSRPRLRRRDRRDRGSELAAAPDDSLGTSPIQRTFDNRASISTRRNSPGPPFGSTASNAQLDRRQHEPQRPAEARPACESATRAARRDASSTPSDGERSGSSASAYGSVAYVGFALVALHQIRREDPRLREARALRARRAMSASSVRWSSVGRPIVQCRSGIDPRACRSASTAMCCAARPDSACSAGCGAAPCGAGREQPTSRRRKNRQRMNAVHAQQDR